MSLKVVRKRATGSLGLDLVMKTADMAKEAASLISFPPAAVAAAAVLAMLEIVAEVKVNRKDCIRLAVRAAKLLTDLGHRMEGKWERAPKALIDNVQTFSETLVSIRDFMVKASEATWLNRLLSKSSIESALEDYNEQLDEAAQSFHLATIIEIHHAIGTLQRTPQPLYIEDTPTPIETENEPPPSQAVVKPLELSDSLDTIPPKHPSLAIANVKTEEDIFLETLGDEIVDEFGFRRYHQSEVIVRKPHRRPVGWFSGTCEGQINGNKTTVKRYADTKEARRQWVRDVKMLRRLYHQNLPQILGYSDGKTAVPFILLANGSTRDVGLYVQNLLNSQGMASSIRALLHVYRDITSAAMHVQQQLSLTDDQLQDFIEDATYTVDDDNNVVLGLPLPKDGWITARSYNICESLVDRALKYLKELARVEDSPLAGSATRSSAVGKIRQLQALLESLLPHPTEAPALAPELEDILDTDDGAALSLPALRKIALARERHGHTWQERCPAGKFEVGDYGHIPRGGKDFSGFEVLGNVFEIEGCRLDVARDVEGEYVATNRGFPDRQQARPFLLPDGLEGWPLAMLPQATVTVFSRRQTHIASVNEAWKVLADQAAALGARHGVDPHELILITRTLNINDLSVNDWSPPALGHSRLPQRPAFPPPRPGFGSGGGSAFSAPPALPTVIYLFTSPKPDFEPYVTDDVGGRPRPRPVRSTSWCYRCRAGWPVDYANYIQLDKEDFA
ncbi:hypothetical protein OF83DRAFT_1178204 [Amylostereum chailletii]|nr:hypothetical protein OF83DRAFT_1178204 [Amylostereum chailletii]